MSKNQGKNEQYIDYTKKCAQYLEWEYKMEHGSSNLLDCLLNGKWDEERFLFVEPENYRYK